ncbi:MAG: hypothetical protein ACLGHP_04305 [Vicinamibacteria bacterium]
MAAAAMTTSSRCVDAKKRRDREAWRRRLHNPIVVTASSRHSTPDRDCVVTIAIAITPTANAVRMVSLAAGVENQIRRSRQVGFTPRMPRATLPARWPSASASVITSQPAVWLRFTNGAE